MNETQATADIDRAREIAAKYGVNLEWRENLEWDNSDVGWWEATIYLSDLREQHVAAPRIDIALTGDDGTWNISPYFGHDDIFSVAEFGAVASAMPTAWHLSEELNAETPTVLLAESSK